jgi:hypothetical protein
MQDRFELVLGLGILEHEIAHAWPVESAIRVEIIISKYTSDLTGPGLSACCQFVRDSIGVDDCGAHFRQRIGDTRLAAADAACERNDQRHIYNVRR